MQSRQCFAHFCRVHNLLIFVILQDLLHAQDIVSHRLRPPVSGQYAFSTAGCHLLHTFSCFVEKDSSATAGWHISSRAFLLKGRIFAKIALQTSQKVWWICHWAIRSPSCGVRRAGRRKICPVAGVLFAALRAIAYSVIKNKKWDGSLPVSFLYCEAA